MRTALTAAGFLLIVAFLLGAEHRAHLFGVLTFALVLACPLLHLFMHSKHGRITPRDPHGGHGARPDARS
jgi:hypothetical protein